MEEAEAGAFMARVEALLACGRLGGLGRLEAGILAASHLGIAGDSRSFARRLGLAHALTLRAMALVSAEGLLDVVRRDPRTQRSFWALSPAGRDVVTAAASWL